MSHVDSSGFTVRDIEALKQLLAEHPTLEMVEASTYETDGIYQYTLLSPLYQIAVVVEMVKAGVDVRQLAKDQGVELPVNLQDLMSAGWTATDQDRLARRKEFTTAFNSVAEKVGNDASYVIRARPDHKTARMSEIAVIRSPLSTSEYILQADTYSQGRGLFRLQGVGSVNSQGEWGNELKQAYSVLATERHIQQKMKAGDYASYAKQRLPDGGISFKIEVAE